ncbi:alcohol acetyltransferase [Aspergillus cavernicola]|uniref:Alcohol acetyltransferase n=1 Tax=Aspergillus cavernicola TaxID=176166 RepID=A0ABR4IRA5_9EURO
MDKLEKLRPVGNLEKLSAVRHPMRYYLNVAHSANYTVPETFTLPLKEYVYKAVETLIARHPVLSAIILDEDTEEPYFVRLPEVDLAEPISFQKRAQSFPSPDERDSELESFLQTQHDTGFTAPKPFWRLIILTADPDDRRFTAIFVYHHALGDGTSGKAFHRTFLQALRDTASLKPDEAKRVVTSPKTPLLPNLEAAHPLPISIPYLVKTLLKELFFSKQDPKVWAGAAHQFPMTTQIRTLVLPAAQTSALVKICRDHSTTVTCALQTAIARSIFTHIPDKYTRVAFSGAISSRAWLEEKITDEEIGVWVQEFDELYSRKAMTKPTFPWAEAKRSRQTITKELKQQSKNTSVGLLKYIKDFRTELFEPKIGKPRKLTCEVSSLGVVKTENPGDGSLPQMDRVVFSQSASVTGSAMEFSVITGADGCLALGVAWQTGIVEEDLVQGIIDTLKKELDQLCA